MMKIEKNEYEYKSMQVVYVFLLCVFIGFGGYGGGGYGGGGGGGGGGYGGNRR